MTSMYQIKTAYRCTWLKIFHHKVDRGSFADEREVRYSVVEGKFSILGLINDNYKIDGKFEFMIEFPNLTNRQGMNRWAQSDNPLDINESNRTNVPRFEPITLSWPNATTLSGESSPFYGLARSGASSTLIDGACHYPGHLFYCIGLLGNLNIIPGETDYNRETILWLRIEKPQNDIYNIAPKLIVIMGLFLTEYKL